MTPDDSPTNMSQCVCMTCALNIYLKPSQKMLFYSIQYVNLQITIKTNTVSVPKFETNVLISYTQNTHPQICSLHISINMNITKKNEIMYVVEKLMNDWITNNMLALKKIDENMSPFGVGLDLLFTLICIRKVCKAVKQAIIESKTKITQQKISDY